jgi:hypothetical protein
LDSGDSVGVITVGAAVDSLDDDWDDERDRKVCVIVGGMSEANSGTARR